MAQHSSRLHRLLTLLDTGSTQATRFAAAKQIGDIAKSHPQDLNSLLKKVSHYLHSKNWDTRVAAAQAVGAIAENVKHMSMKDIFACIDVELSKVGHSDASNRVGAAWSNFLPDLVAGLTFQSFEINRVLEFGSPLLASGGQEYDVAIDGSKTPAERLARQKKSLRRRLGLDVCEQFMDLNDVIRDEDLLFQKGSILCNGVGQKFYASHSGQNIQQLVSKMVPTYHAKRLSRRELNLLKRKAKVNAKDHSKVWSEDDEVDGLCPTNSMGPTATCVESIPDKVGVDAFVDEDISDNFSSGSWPFLHFLEQLTHDMFDPVWEVRHGTIMALREILSHQGSCAGVFMPDLSIERSPSVGSNYESSSDLVKRKREEALNMQMNMHDPAIKRQRSGEGEPSQRISETLTYKAMDYCTDIKIDVGGWLTCSGTLSSDDTNLHVKEGFSNGLGVQSESLEDKLDEKPTPVDNWTILNMDLLANVPESSKLVNLIKLARRSWIKNWDILQDCAVRFLCVLSLDRFGDYVSDQVVAPVRETCAQALGAILKYMHPTLVRKTLNILLQMQHRQEWEIRHGSLLGMKYLVAVRREMLSDLLPYILPACKAGLEDPDDDVRAVAAEALIPAAAAIVSLKGQALWSIIILLWDILLDLDDLSPSTSSVMNLLSEIYTQPEMILEMLQTLVSAGKQEFDLNEVCQTDDHGDRDKYEGTSYILSSLTPRLWPFTRHIISSVRLSAMRTLERLLEVGYRGKPPDKKSNSFWLVTILGDALRIVFQNLLIESDEDILCCSERVWKLLLQSPLQDLEDIARSYFSSWMELATTPYGSSLDATKMFCPVALPRRSRSRAASKMRIVKPENEWDRNYNSDPLKENNFQGRYNDLSNLKVIVGADGERPVIRTRVVTATALGILASKMPEASLHIAINPLCTALTSLSGLQRQVASMVLISWFKELQSKEPLGKPGLVIGLLDPVRQWLLDLLGCSDPAFPTKGVHLPYAELSRTYSKMRNEVSIIINLVRSSGTLPDILANSNIDLEVLTASDAINLLSKLSLPNVFNHGEGMDGKQVNDDMESCKQRLLSTASYTKCVQDNLHVTVVALIAAAVVWISELPTKLNPIILPLMTAVKKEQEELLQLKAAEALAELIFRCMERKPSPNEKLIKNICSLTYSDPCETPQVTSISSMEVIDDEDLMSFRKTPSIQKGKAQTQCPGEDRSIPEGFLSRRGSEFALKHLCSKFGSSLFDKLPKLWDCLTENIKPVGVGDISADEQQSLQLLEFVKDKDPQALVNNIQVVRSVTPLVDKILELRLLTLLPCLLVCVRHGHVAVKLAASKCITTMAKSLSTCIMGSVLEKVIPMLGDANSVHARQGAGMLVNTLVQGLGEALVPCAPLLVVPLLRCMSDVDHTVRQIVTHSFAALVPLLPLARGCSPPAGLREALSRDLEDVTFLEQLLDNSHIEDYKLPFVLNVALRRYQQEGINWLSFLKRFKLHGILCDDMGLGKTLQALAIVASDSVDRQSCIIGDDLSLVVCPSTLVGHWAYEIDKYIDKSIMSPLQYVGGSPDRTYLREQFHNFNVIITSYDIVRKDIDYLRKFSWNYCILDEGHIIKNARSKVTLAVKQLKAERRLLLSGTPIQNNVLELWSLFDFLMPGFLGTERQFQAKYGKPLLASRDSRCSAREAEAGVLAIEALHKQVMPFLLRRTKDEVLSDLPAKIIQDRYCDLCPVQLKLYEQFSISNAKREISELADEDQAHNVTETAKPQKATAHVFQAVQYLLKLCSHPLLAIGKKPPDALLDRLTEIMPSCGNVLAELHELHHSPKLVALKEILEECGIGVDTSTSEGALAVGQHRVLVFAQHKSFLDIIEKDLFEANMKSVTYLRLDGSVEPEKRFEIVKAFNSDPTIDVLLLTTHVGGLGLNLTSADTLVFMEHDWNPMRDNQAMDRAHRLGQRKVVNVHRLIMRGTLEEKVMSLQKFKVSIANAVINAENASLKTMNTDQLLDLFGSASPAKKFGVSSSNSIDLAGDSKPNPGGKGLKAILSGLGELWDHSQYSEEYDLSRFLAKLDG